MGNRLSCIYADGLTTKDPSILSTLALFYDEIWMPHPYDLDPECESLVRWPFKYLEDLEWKQKAYLEWRSRLKELFDAGVLNVLPPPIPAQKLPDDFAQQFAKLNGTIENYFSSSMVYDGMMALTVHTLFNEEETPEWSLDRTAKSLDVGRDRILHEWLCHRMPHIDALPPQQILEFREKAAPYRAGVSEYINSKLVTYYEVLGNANWNEDQAAELLVKSVIEPEMYDLNEKKFLENVEFVVGLAKKAGALAGKVITTITTPWQWANAFALVEKFGDNVEHIVKHYKDRRSKEQRALKFINVLES